MDRHVLVAEGIPPWLAVWWRLFTWWFMVGIGSLVWLPSPKILKTRVWLYLHHSFIIPSSGEWLALLLKGWSGWGSLMVTGSGFIALKLPMNDGAGITLLSPSLAWPQPELADVSFEKEKQQLRVLLTLGLWAEPLRLQSCSWWKPRVVASSPFAPVPSLHTEQKQAVTGSIFLHRHKYHNFL